jgi:MFS family permease
MAEGERQRMTLAPDRATSGFDIGLMRRLVAASACLYWVAQYLYAPTLPNYAHTKTDDLQLIGMALSMYGLGHLIIRLPVGIVAAWLGRNKPWILAGLLMTALGAWTMGAAPGIQQLIVGRAISGLAAGTWVPLVLAYCELFSPQEAIRASAVLVGIGSVARMVATAATGVLNQVGGYRLAFFAASAAAGLAVVVTLPVQERRKRPWRPAAQDIVRTITRRQVLLPAVLAAMVQHVDWSVTFGFLPILNAQLGATSISQSLSISVNQAMFMLGSFLVPSLTDRTGARNVANLACGLLSFGVVAASLASALPVAFLGQFCIGLGGGLYYPVLMGMSVEHVTGAQRAVAMGLHQSVYAIGMFSGPWVGGLLANSLGIRPTFAVTGAGFLLLSLSVMRALSWRPRVALADR